MEMTPLGTFEDMSLCSRHKHLEKNGLFTLKKLKIDPFQLPKFTNVIDISYFVAARPHSTHSTMLHFNSEIMKINGG